MNRILVCDDEPLLRDMIASTLCMSGFSVIEANDGKEALHQIEQQIPDAIILDLNMPNLGGIDVLRQIRDLCKKCPIIVITGADDPDKIQEARSLGIRDVLEKPFNLSQVISELRKYLPSLI